MQIKQLDSSVVRERTEKRSNTLLETTMTTHKLAEAKVTVRSGSLWKCCKAVRSGDSGHKLARARALETTKAANLRVSFVYAALLLYNSLGIERERQAGGQKEDSKETLRCHKTQTPARISDVLSVRAGITALRDSDWHTANSEVCYPAFGFV